MPGSTTPYGITYPVASDLIKDTSLEAKLADQIQTLAVTADQAVDLGKQAAIDDATSKYGATDAPSGFDANSVTGQAVHVVYSGDNALNMPGAGSWILHTVPVVGGLQQTALSYSIADPKLYTRVSGSTGWSAWVRIGGKDTDAVTVTLLAADQDLHLLDSGGTSAKRWSLAATPTDWQAQHLPVNVRGTVHQVPVGSSRIMTYTTWEASPRLFAAYKSGSNPWGEWREIGPADGTWLKDSSVPTGGSFDDYIGTAEGKQVKLKVPTQTVADGISGPWPADLGPVPCAVFSYGVGSTGSVQMMQTYSVSDPRLYVRTNTAPWVRVGVAGDQAASGLKTVGLPVTAGHSGSDAPLSGTYRIGLSWLSQDVPVSRVKVRIRNINIRNGVTRAGNIDLAGVWLGVPDANGHFAAAPVQVAPATTFDGAAGFESPWVNVPGGTLSDKAISYAYTAASAPWAQLADAWYDADQVGGNTGATGFAYSSTAAFTVDLIVETYATTPVIATMGDSNSVGVGAKYVSEAWGTRLAHQLKAIPQLLGSSGDTIANSLDTEAFKWTRFAGHTRADAILWALGQNDVAGARPVADIIADADTVIPKASKLGSAVYVVSLMPRTNDPHATFEADRRAVNAALADQSRGDRGYLDIVPAMSTDDDTIISAYDADGTHLNSAGTQAVADHLKATYRVTTPPVQYAVI